MLRALANEGFIVISEVRSGSIIPCTYAKRVTTRVTKLLAAGVPAENITVSGYSIVGAIALRVASHLSNEEINYVIMTGCEIASIKKYKMYRDFTKLKGIILSIYASSDTIAGSCNQVFSMATDGIHSEEIVLASDSGHRLFFAANSK